MEIMQPQQTLNTSSKETLIKHINDRKTNITKPELEKEKEYVKVHELKDESLFEKQKLTLKQEWLKIEDAKLKEFVKIYGEDWQTISKKFPNRTHKQCRERWYSQLDPPDIKKGSYLIINSL